MIRSGELADEDEIKRFRNEAEAVAKLQHPNIVQIYDLGEFDRQAYFVMEFVEGGDLSKHAQSLQPFSQSARYDPGRHCQQRSKDQALP